MLISPNGVFIRCYVLIVGLKFCWWENPTTPCLTKTYRILPNHTAPHRTESDHTRNSILLWLKINFYLLLNFLSFLLMFIKTMERFNMLTLFILYCAKHNAENGKKDLKGSEDTYWNIQRLPAGEAP